MRIITFYVLCYVSLCSSDEDKNETRFGIFEGGAINSITTEAPTRLNCTWNGLDGECISIHDCPSAKYSLRRKIYPPICSFHGNTPSICCTDCDLKGSTTDPVPDTGVASRFNETHSKARGNCLNFLKNLPYPCSFPTRIQYEERRNVEKNCYEYVPTPSEEETASLSLEEHRNSYHEDPKRAHYFMPLPPISHGIDARRSQYPHMALLGYGDNVKTAQWLCGGSVISEIFILTAAHCISSPSVGPVKYAALGIHKRSDPLEVWQIHKIKRVIPHPEYKPPSKYNDIALLETKNTISFSINVLPACLHLEPESAETAEATGWGTLGHHQELANTLQTVKLQRYDKERCSQLYPVHRHLSKGYDHSSQMCYGDTEGPKDTCEGDSGGPLQVANEVLSCAYTVVGVTSYGRQCGISAGSGMYTRVYHYVPWIEDIVWP